MSYTQIAQLELLNALKSITSEAELNEFKDLVAHFFAAKAQKEIDAMWDNGTINEDTINQWGAEYMRTYGTKELQARMVKESITTAFDELYAGEARKNAQNLFS